MVQFHQEFPQVHQEGTLKATHLMTQCTIFGH
uniref:Uncharacterized protein n=1 Tax=Rhizophora mucronata TaxID=61149 RepID=A0A2P2J162_RHIMU